MSAGRSDSSSEDSGSEPEAELMITTRERRKTAGNRYSQVVAQEQADEDEQDEVTLLFAEAEGEDEEYNSDEADDEADMSSSDDDDQGPNAAADDMEGEKEIEKQAKAQQQKKRKAEMALTTMSGIRKKPKLDPTSLHRAPERSKPSKRKERVSWLPDEAAAPGRTSLRKQTVAHREVMLERLKESEEQRLKNKVIREEKEKIKQADAPKEMTQADRLAEAGKNERRNAKSLNRWEAQEARRLEEQAAKLAALKDRKLNGAVITLHSSAHVYRGLKTDRLSPGPSGTDENRPKKRGPKPKVLQDHLSTPQLAAGSFVQSPFTSIAANHVRPQVPTPAVASSGVQIPTLPAAPASHASGDNWLAGIHEYASMQPTSGQVTPQEDQNTATSTQQNDPSAQEPKSVGHQGQPQDQASLNVDRPQPEPTQTDMKNSAEPGSGTKPVVPEQSEERNISVQPLDPANSRESPLITATIINSETRQTEQVQPQQPAPILPLPPHVTSLAAIPPQQPALSQSPPTAITPSQPVPQPVNIDPPLVKVEVISTKNLVVLDRFEDLNAEAKQAYTVFNNTKKQPKPTKRVGELCGITGYPAKYRDPTTGVPYANVAAFKKLKELQEHAYQWSSMLGCYVGRAGQAARGVPEGFLGT